MAQFGAKVLHPRVIQPAKDSNTPITVKATCKPEQTGTVIDGGGDTQLVIKAVVFEEQVSIFKLSSSSYGSIQSIEQILASLGFDKLFSQVKQDDLYLVMKYQNSDRAIPSDKFLSQSILSAIEGNSEKPVISSNKGLISIIGEASTDAWRERVVVLAKDQGIGDEDIFSNELSDRLSFCCLSPLVLNLVNKFHFRLIES